MRINLVIADTDDGSFETWRRHPNLDGVNARAPSAAIFCASQPAGKQLNKGTLHLPARAEDPTSGGGEVRVPLAAYTALINQLVEVPRPAPVAVPRPEDDRWRPGRA